MKDIGMTLQLLEAFRDRDFWKEGFMIYEDSRETRKNVCGYAIETIKTQQTEIDRLNALLEEQQAKVMMLEEVPKHDVLWMETEKGKFSPY